MAYPVFIRLVRPIAMVDLGPIVCRSNIRVMMSRICEKISIIVGKMGKQRGESFAILIKLLFSFLSYCIAIQFSFFH